MFYSDSNVKIKKYKALTTLHASGLLGSPMPRSSLLHITTLSLSTMWYKGKLTNCALHLKMSSLDHTRQSLLSARGTLTISPNWHVEVLWVGLWSNATFFERLDRLHRTSNNFLVTGEWFLATTSASNESSESSQNITIKAFRIFPVKFEVDLFHLKYRST